MLLCCVLTGLVCMHACMHTVGNVGCWMLSMQRCNVLSVVVYSESHVDCCTALVER